MSNNLVLVKKTISVRNGDRATTSQLHDTYIVYLNNVKIQEFTGYNALWSSYKDCRHEAANFIRNLSIATGDYGYVEQTWENFSKDARAIALAKLTKEERKLLNVK